MKLSRRNVLKSLAALVTMPLAIFGRAKGSDPSTQEIDPAQGLRGCSIHGNRFVNNADVAVIPSDAKPFGLIQNNTIRNVDCDELVISDGKPAGFSQKRKAGTHAIT